MLVFLYLKKIMFYTHCIKNEYLKLFFDFMSEKCLLMSNTIPHNIVVRDC